MPMLGVKIQGSGLALCIFGYVSDFLMYGAEKSGLIYNEKYKDCNVAMMKAYRSQYYTMTEIGNYFGTIYSTVSRTISNAAKCKT